METSAETFEARGFVKIAIPAKLRLRPVRYEPQIKTDAKVLLTPQNRAIYTDDDGQPSAQTQSSLPLAAGEALVNVTPSKGGPLIIDRPDDFDFTFDAIDLDLSIQGLTAEGLALALVAAKSSKLDLRKFNAALKKAGVGMAIETRK